MGQNLILILQTIEAINGIKFVSGSENRLIDKNLKIIIKYLTIFIKSNHIGF